MGYLQGVSLLAMPFAGRTAMPVPGAGQGETIATDLAYEGHCPVSLWVDPTNRDCVIPGNRECQVQYGDLIFRLSNKVAKQAFLERPWAYSDLMLPTKMPAGRAVVNLTELPARGYCEQTLARAITATLNSLCEARPKFPGLSVEDSILKYIALHMRCNNKNENEEQHESSQAMFDEFKESCELARYLKEQPQDAPDYSDKQKKFEERRSKPWGPFLEKAMR